ncbi:hypothetical protein BZL30_2163 [Mycobacterium kansasii]|uniref:Uncharacterized protein n=1 Tax=Mycobacterium kansasii TaxID=1768 RepID=A0A1V3XGS3_MYCKA|nr:hypothetical protein BZL30_2163 [Mycobacterium kansasii]
MQGPNRAAGIATPCAAHVEAAFRSHRAGHIETGRVRRAVM